MIIWYDLQYYNNGISRNQPSKFRTTQWVEVSDAPRATYNIDSQIEFKTSIFWSSLCGYSDAYILVSATMTVSNKATAGLAATKRKTC